MGHVTLSQQVKNSKLGRHLKIIDINSVEEQDDAVQIMQTEIMATLYHCLKLPNKDTSTAQTILGADTVFEKYLLPFYERLSDLAILSCCLPGFTKMIRCPKYKWHGRKRILLATASATLQFSVGAIAKHENIIILNEVRDDHSSLHLGYDNEIINSIQVLSKTTTEAHKKKVFQLWPSLLLACGW
ncbi:unnamed protein product, partial [Pocillopora meandrina]